jgi:cullin 1
MLWNLSAFYDMCTQRRPYSWPRELYDHHGEIVQRYLASSVLPALMEKAGQGNAILLMEVHQRWTNHKIMIKWFNKVFGYLDRFYTKHYDLPRLTAVGLKLFRSIIYEEMKAPIAEAVLSLIIGESDCQLAVDRCAIKSAVQIFEAMNDPYLEEMFLVSTRRYYDRKSAEWASEPILDHLAKVCVARRAEILRSADIFNHRTRTNIVRILGEVAVQPLLEREDGFYTLLEYDKSDDLRQMFCSFETNGIDLLPMARIFRQFVTDQGMMIVKQRESRLRYGEQDTKEDSLFIGSMLALYKKCAAILENNFANHDMFDTALRDAFEGSFNKNIGKNVNAELLSSFCSRTVMTLRARIDDEGFDRTLDSLTWLSCCLVDKDLFAETYRYQLAHRMINHFVCNEDNEKLMVSKLKVAHGSKLTSRIEGLFVDLLVSKGQQMTFQRSTQPAELKIDFGVLILTTGLWPNFRNANVNYPDVMMQCMERFGAWHKHRHESRKLHWLSCQGKANVLATYGKKSYHLQVSTLQAIVLDAVNGGATIRLRDLSVRLNLEVDVLLPVMHSLSCRKYKVLTKFPAGRKIDTSDTFVANSKFASRERKFCISLPSQGLHADKVRMDEDRRFVMEAAIVRIMKARKTLPHQHLISETMSQPLLFHPDVRDLERSIEALVDREYLARSSEDATVYEYLA